MSGTTMKASVLLTLEDQLSGGLSRLVETLDRLNAVAQRLTGTFGHLRVGAPFENAVQPINSTAEAVARFNANIDKLAPALARLNAKEPFREIETQTQAAGEKLHWFERGLNRVRDGITRLSESASAGALREFSNSVGPLGGAIATASIVVPAEKQAAYENILRHIAITEGLSGGAVDPEIARLTALFAGDAQRTGQSSESIAKAFSDLVQIGIPGSILDRVIGAHSAAATAYNISPEALGPAVGALLQNMKVPEDQIGAALAAMAQASKEGRFKVEDFSREFPGIAGQMAMLGQTGRGGADYAFAALETVMRNSSQPSSAGAEFYDALRYITGPFGARAFGREGIDLPGVLSNAAKQGKNPMDAVLDLLQQMTKGMNPVEATERMNKVLHNQQAAQAIEALLLHRPEFNALRQKLDQVGPEQVARDFQTAFAGPITTVRLFDENLAQATRTLGNDFMPEMRLITGGLGALSDGLKFANDRFPILTHTAFAAAGALTLLAAAAGAKSLVGDYAVAGSKLLLSLVGGPEGAALVGGGLLTAEFVNALRRLAEGAAKETPANMPPPPIRLEITADPDLRVRHLGTEDGRLPTLGAPLGLGNSNRVLGRD